MVVQANPKYIRLRNAVAKNLKVRCQILFAWIPNIKGGKYFMEDEEWEDDEDWGEDEDWSEEEQSI